MLNLPAVLISRRRLPFPFPLIISPARWLKIILTRASGVTSRSRFKLKLLFDEVVNKDLFLVVSGVFINRIKLADVMLCASLMGIETLVPFFDCSDAEISRLFIGPVNLTLPPP